MPDKWKRGTIAWGSPDSDSPVWFGVPAWVRGGIGIPMMPDQRKDYYVLIHTRTGLSFGISCRTQRDAKRAADAIMKRYPEIVAGDANTAEYWSRERRAALRAFVKGLAT